MAYDFEYPQTHDAQARGWGRGWQAGDPIGTRPSNLPGIIIAFSHDGVSFPGGIRVELAEMAHALLDESLDRRYIPKLDDPGCWGGAFRPTKRSDGSYTTTPSNHSWYTAFDINAPHNVYGSSTHQIPLAMAELWREYGWRWLGPPIKDWMHFDYAGSPMDAAHDTGRIRKDGIGMALTPDQKATLNRAQKFLDALESSIQAAGATEAGNRVGRAVKRTEADTPAPPAPAPTEPHDHTVKVLGKTFTTSPDGPVT